GGRGGCASGESTPGIAASVLHNGGAMANLVRTRERRETMAARVRILSALIGLRLAGIAGAYWVTQGIHGPQDRPEADNNRPRRPPARRSCGGGAARAATPPARHPPPGAAAGPKLRKDLRLRRRRTRHRRRRAQAAPRQEPPRAPRRPGAHRREPHPGAGGAL